jgi:hypothetical protein
MAQRPPLEPGAGASAQLEGLTMPFDSSADLEARIARAAPGAVIAYFDGDLATVRARDAEVDGVARVALELAERGIVHLLQRRLGCQRWEYRAVVRSRRHAQ